MCVVYIIGKASGQQLSFEGVKSQTWIFNCTGCCFPNCGVVQGSTIIALKYISTCNEELICIPLIKEMKHISYLLSV